MARPSQSEAKRAELLPIVARCFGEQGYRRTTTAGLAKACGVQETILYRLWPGKKQMFLAAIDFVYELSADTWRQVLDGPGERGSSAERLLDYESRHLGEFGLYRIYFAGLSEADDPDIRAALNRMFTRFHEEIAARIAEHRGEEASRTTVEASQAAWAFIGLGLVSNLGRDLELFDDRERRALLAGAGRVLLEDGVP